MDTDVLVMGGLAILMAVWAFTRGKDLPLRGVQAGLGLLQEVWLPLLLGFMLAGLFEVLVSRELLVKWMGKESGVQGILLGWLVGLLMPGGPYVVFPLAASLLKEGRMRRSPHPIALRILARHRVRCLDCWQRAHRYGRLNKRATSGLVVNAIDSDP